MIMFKSAAVLLAISAMAAPFQASDDQPAEYPHYSPRVTLTNRDDCIAYVGNKIAQIAIAQKVMELVEESRKQYKDSFEAVLRGQTTDQYERFMANLPYPDECETVTDQFTGIYRDPECQQHLKPGNEDAENTFLLHVAHSSPEAMTSMEAYIACVRVASETEYDDESVGENEV